MFLSGQGFCRKAQSGLALLSGTDSVGLGDGRHGHQNEGWPVGRRAGRAKIDVHVRIFALDSFSVAAKTASDSKDSLCSIC